MEIYYAIVIFIFGLLFGSFYNVVGYRIPNNMSIVWPHSFCPKCKHDFDNENNLVEESKWKN